MQHSLGVQQSAINQIYVNDAASSAEVDALRTEIGTLQQDLREAQLAHAEGYREKEEAGKQQTRLQELLAQQRGAQQRMQAESNTLRTLLGELDTYPVVGVNAGVA